MFIGWLYLESFPICTPIEAIKAIGKIYGEFDEEEVHKGKFPSLGYYSIKMFKMENFSKEEIFRLANVDLFVFFSLDFYPRADVTTFLWFFNVSMIKLFSKC